MIGRKVKLTRDDKTYTVVDKIRIGSECPIDGYVLIDEKGIIICERYTMLERVVEEESVYVPCGVVHPAGIVTKEDFQSYKEGEGGWVGPPPRNEFC